MTNVKWFLCTTLSVVVIVFAGCSTPVDDSMAEYGQSLQEAHELGKAREFAKANALLKKLLPDPRFAQLPPEHQYYWLHNSAAFANYQRDVDYACATYRKASDTGYATVDDWHMRLYCASRRKDFADGIHSLETALNRWPDALEKFDYRVVSRFVSELVDSDTPVPEQQALLELLFAAKWRAIGGVEPSRYWAVLVRIYMEQGQLERAKEVALRVPGPQALLAMRVSKQFAPLVNALPDHFDLPAAIDRYNASLEQLSRASPRLLSIKVTYVDALNNAGRYQRALAVIDEVLAGGETIASRYDDAREWSQWIFDARAVALIGLGRFDEAEKFLIEGIAASNEKPNVSQTINLAGLYVTLQRWNDADARVRDLVGGASSISKYGQMQLQWVLLRVALGRNDKQAASHALDRLRAMQTDSPSTFQRALLDANRMDEAAALFISRLRDPQSRGEALAEVQDYSITNPTPGDREYRQRWRELRGRKDVQAAVAEVGRIEIVPLNL